jgi:hypothetical protein
MYLYLGHSVMLPYDSVIGLFDLDNTSYSPRTRRFLEQAEREGRLVTVGDDLPKSFVLCQDGDGPVTVYISQLNTATLLRRAESEIGFES